MTSIEECLNRWRVTLVKWSSFLVSEWLNLPALIIRVTILFDPYRRKWRGVTYIGEADFRKVISKRMWLENDQIVNTLVKLISEKWFQNDYDVWMSHLIVVDQKQNQEKWHTCHYKEIKSLTIHNFNIFIKIELYHQRK